MAAAIISIVLLVVLILIAIRMISAKHPREEVIPAGIQGPLIHASGIYSIIRKSPRADMLKIRPQEAEIRKYLASINEDINGLPLTPADKKVLAEQWRQSLDDNIRIVEQGDVEDVEFYFFDFPNGKTCPVCGSYIRQGQFVTRQEIFKNPSIIPPFHLGCSARISPYNGKKNLRHTTIMGMTPFFKQNTPPPLPEWTKTIKRT
jgi:hypothetical protein